MGEISEMDTMELLFEDESMSAEEEVGAEEGDTAGDQLSELWNQADAIDQTLQLMQDVVEQRLDNSPSKLRESEAEMASISGDSEDDEGKSVDWNWNLQRESELETTVSIGGGSDDESSGGHESEVESNLDEEIEEEDDLDVEDHEDLEAKTMRDLKDPYFQHSLEQLGLLRGKNPSSDSCLKQIAYGPQCWQCYDWAPLWTCEKCEKNFHGKCAFYGEGYPDPVFLKVSRNGQKEEFVMTQCTECQLAEVTAMPTLKDVPLDKLNTILRHLATHLDNVYGKNFQQAVHPIDIIARPTLIKQTLDEFPTDAYKTVESFMADYKLIFYQVVRIFSNVPETVPYQVAKSAILYLCGEMRALMSCWECYSRRYCDPGSGNVFGKPLSSPDLYRSLEDICTIPHPLVWVKLKGYKVEYWPAKLLCISGNDEKICTIQCFKESAVRFPDPEKGEEVLCYSKENPNPTNVRAYRRTRQYREYLDNIKSSKAYLGKFEGIQLPERAEPLPANLSYDIMVKKFFPNYSLRNEDGPTSSQM